MQQQASTTRANDVVAGLAQGLRVVFIDNFDSFTFNLVDAFACRGAEVEVWRNDISLADLQQRLERHPGPALLVLSPGPGTPAASGVCGAAVHLALGRWPVLGVCLGHQVLIEALGGSVDLAPRPMHGRASAASHTGRGLFAGLPQPMTVGRYHSLAAVQVPQDLEVCATAEGVVMAVQHREHPVWGVQFHPESILTPEGGLLLQNVMRLAIRAQSAGDPCAPIQG